MVELVYVPLGMDDWVLSCPKSENSADSEHIVGMTLSALAIPKKIKVRK